MHLASRHPARFPSLLIESSLCRIFELPMVANIAAMMGPQGAVLLQALPDPFDQLGKLRAAPTVRCTVLHGDRDELIPLAQGKALFGASAAPPSRKRLVVLKGAGHNDMGMHATYRELVAAFLAAHAADADADGGRRGAHRQLVGEGAADAARSDGRRPQRLCGEVGPLRAARARDPPTR